MTDADTLPVIRSDESLMTSVRTGDVSCLRELFERYHLPLYRFLVRHTGRREAAEDIVQEVFLRVLKYRHSYQPDQTFRPWLYRIARNLWADTVEREDRRNEVALVDTLRGHQATDAEVEIESERRALHRALARLPSGQREILLLARFNELPYREIAELLDISVANVKVRVFRAVEALRQIMIANPSQQQ